MHGPLLATPARWGGKAEFTIADEATETLPDEYCDEQSLIAPRTALANATTPEPIVAPPA
ncbi:MAG TPA: hypothetical protein DIT58_06660 [Porticoccaceae bacterium]|nr:hypothetical protein [Porticoccaceae bacterium]